MGGWGLYSQTPGGSTEPSIGICKDGPPKYILLDELIPHSQTCIPLLSILQIGAADKTSLNSELQQNYMLYPVISAFSN